MVTVVKHIFHYKDKNNLKTAKDKNSALLDKYLSPEILIIDDLGTEPMLRNITKEFMMIFFQIIMIKVLPILIIARVYLEEN